MASSAQPAGMVLHITRRAADRIRQGHLWVYRSDIERTTGEDADAGLATIIDSRGKPLGSGLYSAASEIAARIVSPRTDLTRTEYVAELRQRLQAAIALRRALVPDAFAANTGTNACRVFFAEADGLPGIIADRYNEVIVLQLLTHSSARDDVRSVLREVLSAEQWAGIVLERPDPRIRELEHLTPAPDTPLFQSDGAASPQTVFHINGLGFHF